MNIRIDNYGSENTSNAMVVSFGSIKLWFSYHTLIAFQDGDRKIVSENLWGSTTGKHLNLIDGGNVKMRYKRDCFDQEWNDFSESIIKIVGD